MVRLTDDMTPSAACREVVSILTEYGRPLSRRRIALMALGRNTVNSEAEMLLDAGLALACENRSLVEVRAGVFAISQEHLEELEEGARRPRRSKRRNRNSSRPRMSRKARAEAGFPAAPISLEETAAMSIQADDRAHLADALWKRLNRSAAQASGQDVFTTQDLPDDDDVFMDADSLDASLSELDVSDDQVELTEAPIKPVKPPRLSTRAYRDERSGKDDYEGLERRQPRSQEYALPQAMFSDIVELLNQEKTFLSLESLAERLSYAHQATAGELRETMDVANDRCLGADQRPIFVLDGFGRVGLTSWSCSKRYLALEEDILGAVAEQRECVRRAILERTSDLEDRSFRRLVIMLLSRTGYDDFEEVHHTENGQVMLTARRGRGVEHTVTAVIAQQSWATVDVGSIRALRDNLTFFGAQTGVIIAVGRYTAEAIEEASRSDLASVQLIDGEGLAQLMYDHQLGVQTHDIKVGYVDGRFFRTLDA